MYTNFDEWDLEHIDYEGTSNLFRFCNLKKDDDSGCARFLYGSFEFLIKDGRKFCCKQDLNHVFTIHSDKYGDVEGNLWVKLAADAINDNDKFVTIVETIKNSTDYVGELCSWAQSTDRLIRDGMLQILVQHNDDKLKTLFLELIKMGLDKDNKFVTINPATNKD